MFEYKKGDERKPLDEAVNLLLPMVQTITVGHLLNDPSPASLTMQRYVLKIFYALTQVSFVWVSACINLVKNLIVLLRYLLHCVVKC